MTHRRDLRCNMSEKLNVEEWLAIRKQEGLKIDPETAEVSWHHAQTFDPYGVDPVLRNSNRLDGNTSPDHLIATSGFTLAIYPRKSVRPFGKEMSPNWRFL
jgi:hypothetical protein